MSIERRNREHCPFLGCPHPDHCDHIRREPVVYASEYRALEAQAAKLRMELEIIALAKRFDRERFSDDAEFATWAQSRANFTLGRNAAGRALLERVERAEKEPRLWWVGLAEYPEDSGWHPIAASTKEEAFRIARERELFGDDSGDEPQELSGHLITENDVEAIQEMVDRLMERAAKARKALSDDDEDESARAALAPEAKEQKP